MDRDGSYSKQHRPRICCYLAWNLLFLMSLTALYIQIVKFMWARICADDILLSNTRLILVHNFSEENLWSAFVCYSLIRFPVCLKPPILMDHACGREANQNFVTCTKWRQSLLLTFWPQKLSLSIKLQSWETKLPEPPSFYVHALRYRWTTAILIPLDL